jgi:glycosyltransferase involved in cell wall biosynthesis
MLNVVNIIVPVFRNTKYLNECLQSVADQTCDNFVVTLCNDSDNDSADKGISDAVKNFGELIRIRQQRTNNIGATLTRDKAIREYLCEFYIPLDSDDKIAPTFIEDTMRQMDRENSRIGFVYVDSVYFTSNGEQRVPSPDYSFYRLLENNFISYCSLFSRDAYLDSGGYNKRNFSYYEDYELYTRMGSSGYYGKHLAKDLFYYRVREDSSFQSDRAQKLGGLYRANIINEQPELFPLEWQRSASELVAAFPEGFISWTPQQQEDFIKKVG